MSDAAPERRVGEHVALIDEGDGVATLRMDRPPVNALDFQMWDELRQAALVLAHDADTRAVVLWGGRKTFAAGADIKAMAAEDFQEFSAHGDGLQQAARALARLPQIVIAAITGYALGGGCEVALAADFRYAAEDAKLGQPEIQLGVIPGAGGTQRLPRLVGVQKARELVYSGRIIAADEALEIGLVDRLCPPDEVHDLAVAQARTYARGPYALRYAKQAIDDGVELGLDAALQLESTLFAACFATEDRAIGMRSFLEQGPGKAEFTGR